MPQSQFSSTTLLVFAAALVSCMIMSHIYRVRIFGAWIRESMSHKSHNRHPQLSILAVYCSVIRVYLACWVSWSVLIWSIPDLNIVPYCMLQAKHLNVCMPWWRADTRMWGHYQDTQQLSGGAGRKTSCTSRN